MHDNMKGFFLYTFVSCYACEGRYNYPTNSETVLIAFIIISFIKTKWNEELIYPIICVDLFEAYLLAQPLP